MSTSRAVHTPETCGYRFIESRWDRRHAVIKRLLHVQVSDNTSRQENKFVYLVQTSEGGGEEILCVGCTDYSVLGHCRHHLRQGATEERRHCDPAPTPPVCKYESAWPVKGQRKKTWVTMRIHWPQVIITSHTTAITGWVSNENTIQHKVLEKYSLTLSQLIEHLFKNHWHATPGEASWEQRGSERL